MATLRVLFVGAFPPPERPVFGGMVTSCRALLDSTFKERVTLRLFDTTQISNPPPGFFRRLGLAALRVVRFIRCVERWHPEVVLLFAAEGGSIVEKGLMAWYCRFRGIASVLFPRAGAVVDSCERSAVLRTVTRASLAGATKLVCQSERWAGFATRSLGFSRRDVAIVRNWTATPELLRIGLMKRPPSAQPVRILFIGWIEREKGVLELIEACRLLRGKYSFLVDLAGNGSIIDEAKAVVSDAGLQRVVTFRGRLSEAEVHAALAAADILTLPSWAEGLPNALVEAMSTRVAIVATTVGAVPEILEDGVSALLVPPRDTPALSSALSRLIGSAALREALAGRAYHAAQAEFGVERAVSELMDVIKSAAGARSS